MHISVNTLKVPMNIILLSSAFSSFSAFGNLSYVKPHNNHISFPYIDLYHIFSFSFGRLSYLKFYDNSILHSIQGALSQGNDPLKHISEDDRMRSSANDTLRRPRR